MRAQAASSLWRSPRDASAELVALFVPGADGEEKALRTRIHLARDRAQARAERMDSFEGSRICHLASAIASEWVFRRETGLDELNEVLAALSQLFLAAGKFDRLESSRG